MIAPQRIQNGPHFLDEKAGRRIERVAQPIFELMNANLVDHAGIGDGFDRGAAQWGALQVSLGHWQFGPPVVAARAEEGLPYLDTRQVPVLPQDVADVGCLRRKKELVNIDERNPWVGAARALDAVPVG